MAGEPAIVKVTTALSDLLGGMAGTSIFVDRGDDDPIREDERPAVALRVVDTQFDPSYGQAETRHAVTLDMDFYEEDMTTGSISAALSRMIAAANALIASDRTLGGMLERFELISATAELDATPDLGCAIVTAELSFITPRGDFTTIQGATGIF